MALRGSGGGEVRLQQAEINRPHVLYILVESLQSFGDFFQIPRGRHQADLRVGQPRDVFRQAVEKPVSMASRTAAGASAERPSPGRSNENSHNFILPAAAITA